MNTDMKISREGTRAQRHAVAVAKLKVKKTKICLGGEIQKSVKSVAK